MSAHGSEANECFGPILPFYGDFFSDFKVDGSALGPQDGVFHQAASDWRVLPTAAD